jgi:DNA-binding SARP family transcriptional activator
VLMSDRVTFGVLGPLAARRGHELLNLGGPKQRMVLAVLLANANRTVCRDELIEAVWAGDPPTTARTTMHTYLSNLRKELGDGQIVHRGDGYGVTVDASTFDALRFDELVWQGHALLGVQPREAALCLDQAQQLWRGPAFGQLGSEPFLLAEATRLNELHLFAEEDRFEAYLINGEHTRIIGQLRNLIDNNPYRERLLGQLMLALYRSGRQGDALRVFAETRRRFSDELGIDPSPELWTLEQQILEQRFSLDVREETRASPDLKVRQPLPGSLDKANLKTRWLRPRRLVIYRTQVAILSVIVGVLAIGAFANLGTRTALTQRPGCIEPPAEMVGWWPGDDTSDDEIGRRSALLINGASYGEGLVGHAYLFDGIDDWVAVPGPGPEIGTSDFTIDLWVNFSSTTGEQVLAEKWVETFDENSIGWTLTKLEDDSFGMYGRGFGTTSNPLHLPLEEWVHIAVRREADEIELLVDGEVVDHQRTDAQSSDDLSPASLKFGHRGGAQDTPGTLGDQGFYLNGQIDEVHLFVGRALSYEDIRSIVEAGSAGLCRPVDTA